MRSAPRTGPLSPRLPGPASRPSESDAGSRSRRTGSALRGSGSSARARPGPSRGPIVMPGAARAFDVDRVERAEAALLDRPGIAQRIDLRGDVIALIGDDAFE